MFAKQKTPEPTPTRREYNATGPVPVVRGRRLVQGIMLNEPWNAWNEPTSGSGNKPEATYYSLVFGICHGPVKEIRNLYLNGRRLGWVGNTNLPVPFKVRPTDPEDPEYYYADFSIGIDGNGKHTPIQGRIYWGDTDQPADTLLSHEAYVREITAGSWGDGAPRGGYGYYRAVRGLSNKMIIGAPPQAHPAYSGICYIVFYSYETDFSSREGGTAIGDFQVEVVCENETYQDTNDLADDAAYGVNPVGFIADILKNSVWGLGLDDTIADTDELIEDIERMQDNGYFKFQDSDSTIKQGYLSPILGETKNAGELLGGLFDYFDGYLKMVDGRIRIDWFDNRPVDITGMLEIDRSMMAEELKTAKGPTDTWEDTINEITVDYTDGQNLFGNAGRTVRDAYNRYKVLEPRRVTLQANQIINGDTAEKYAARKLLQRIEPIRSYSLTLPVALAVDDDGAPLLPGAQFLLDYAPWELDIVVRVIERDEQGDTVTLTLDTEPGNYPLEYIEALDPRILPPEPVAAVFETFRIWELPAQITGQIHPPKVTILAKRENAGILFANVYFSQTDAWAGEEELLEPLSFFAGYAKLSSGIDSDDTSITLTEINFDALAPLNRSYTAAEVANDTVLALIDNELVVLETLTTPSDATRTYSILRARQGTTAASHSTNADVWVFRLTAIQQYSHGAFRLTLPYNSTLATSYWKLASVTVLEEGDLSDSEQLVLASPFPVIQWNKSPVNVGYYAPLDWDVTIVNTTGKLMRVAIGLAGPNGEWIPLAYTETVNNFDFVHTKPLQPTDGATGTWRLGVWASYVAADAATSVADGKNFTLSNPTLVVALSAPSNAVRGSIVSYYGAITNAGGLKVRWVMMLTGPSNQTIILATDITTATSFSPRAEKTWIDDELGEWTLYLGAYFIYDGAPATPVEDTKDFDLTAGTLGATFSTPAADAQLLHRKEYDVVFSISNPENSAGGWALLYEGPEVGGKRRGRLLSSGGLSNGTTEYTVRMDTSFLDLYSQAEQNASPYRLRLTLSPRFGLPRVIVYRNFKVTLPQPLSAHFGEVTEAEVIAEGYHLRDGDLRSEGGAEIRYEEATTSWKRQTAITIPSATRPDGEEIARSDFSSGFSGGYNFACVVAGNQTVGGTSGWLRAYADATNDLHGITQEMGALVVGRRYRLRVKIYFPEDNSSSTLSLALHAQPVALTMEPSDEIQIWDTEFESIGTNPTVYFFLRSGNIFAGANDPDDDVFFIKDFCIIDITDGQEVIHNDRWIDTSDDYKKYIFDADSLQWNRDTTTFSASRITTGEIAAAIIELFGSAILKGTADTDIDTGAGLFLRGENGATKAQFRVGDVTDQHIMFDGQTGDFSIAIGTDDSKTVIDSTGLQFGTNFSLDYDSVGGSNVLQIGSSSERVIIAAYKSISVQFLYESASGSFVINSSSVDSTLPARFHNRLRVGTTGSDLKLIRLYNATASFGGGSSGVLVNVNITAHGFSAAPDFVFVTILGAASYKLTARYDKANSSATSLRILVGTVDGTLHSGNVDIQIQAIMA